MKKYVLFVFLFGLFACEIDVLDKRALDEIDEETMWENLDLARLYVNYSYRNMPGSWDRYLDLSTNIGEGGHSWLTSNRFNTGNVTNNNGPYSGAWSTHYGQIRRLNTFFVNAGKIQDDPEAIEMLIGEVYFLRAFYYTDLVMLFGNVPIIKEPQSLQDDLLVSRASFDECINFIVSDLEEAAKRLPKEWEGVDVGRATVGAAHALKSRLLLFAASKYNNPNNDRNKWEKVVAACEQVFNLGVYSLFPVYDELFIKENNEEVIFDVQYAYTIRNNNIDYYNNPQGFSGAYGMLRPTQEFVDWYEMDNGLPITDPASGYDPDNPYVGRDPRFYMSILYNGAPWRGKTIEMFINGANGPGNQEEYGTSNSMTGYYARKFLNETNPIAYGIPKAEENWILIRYAEVLLNYAEAKITLGKYDDARTAMNQIRARAGMPDIPDSESGDALYNRYINERIVELCFEDRYFFDVRRWYKAKEWLGIPVHKMEINKIGEDDFTYEVKVMENRTWRDDFYWMPIPRSELERNPNLSNFGY